MTPPPLIRLIYGNQQLRIDETANSLVQSIMEDRDPEFSLQRFDLMEMLKDSSQDSLEEKLDQFRVSCETLPFLSDRKIIRIDHLEKLKQPRGKKNASSTFDPAAPPSSRLYPLLLNYLSHPPEYCSFILTAFASRDQDFSAPLLKVIKSRGKIQKFVAYDDDKPIGWIVERAKQKKISIRPGAAQLLLDLLGNDLSGLDHELEKLSLLEPNRSTLNEDDLMAHVRSAKYFSIFRITQALSQKDLVSALETLDQIMMESSTGHIGLFVLIYQQLIKLLKVHYLKQQNLSPPAIISKLKLHPFLGKRLVSQADSFSESELEKIIVRMADLDLEFKFNAREARGLFQNLFQEICTGYYR
ncbi:MAG: DNA polymerase III subunit delta [SAR324 cluster bacterium]|nr:DNA polymerase III subunit delta [SAR324 cluster bacterium]